MERECFFPQLFPDSDRTASLRYAFTNSETGSWLRASPPAFRRMAILEAASIARLSEVAVVSLYFPFSRKTIL